MIITIIIYSLFNKSPIGCTSNLCFGCTSDCLALLDILVDDWLFRGTHSDQLVFGSVFTSVWTDYNTVAPGNSEH